LWRVLHILTEPVPYTFVSVYRRNNKAWAGLHYSVDLRTQTYTEPVPLNYAKLATNYLWIYGYFLQCVISEALCQCAPLQHDRLFQLVNDVKLSAVVDTPLQCPKWRNPPDLNPGWCVPHARLKKSYYAVCKTVR